VRVFGDDRDARETLLQEICSALDAAPVQHLGKLLVIFRENPDKSKSATKRPRTAKPEDTTTRAGGQLRATTTRRPRAQGASERSRPVAPSGVPRAGLPRRRRART
jgi:hypothetical protein